MVIDASVLNLFPSASGSASDTLLGTVYGSSAGTGGDPIQALQAAEAGQTKAVALVAAKPDVARDIASFRAAVAAAKTPADLLSNPTALRVLLTANGLGDQAGYTALAKKALLSDTTKATSLANTLTDARWKTAAQTYDFAHKGLSVLKSATALNAIANGYAQVQWQTSLDQATPGLSAALDFRSRAGTIKSVDQVLGDATFRNVITTALGIPKQIAYQSLMTQEHAISSRIDLTKFKDPKFTEQFVKQFLVANAASVTSGTGTSGAGTSGNGLLSLFA